MLNTIFQGLFDADTVSVIAVSDFLICVGCALVIGLILAFAYMYRTRYTRSFVVTLAMLPAVVCVVIMMVNGNVGTGVGLICGMGYLGFAFLFAIILGAVLVLYSRLDFGARTNDGRYKTLRITIPEDLDYTEVFEDLFAEYTQGHELVSVKTTNMGSLFRLTYNVTLGDPKKEKELIDKLRCRNGNLEIGISRQETATAEL